MRALPPLARISFVAILVASCASSPGSGGSGGSGGTSNTGGNGTGGSKGTGGMTTGTGGTGTGGMTTGTSGGTGTGGMTTGTGGNGAGGSGTGGGTGTGGMAGHGSGGGGGASATGGVIGTGGMTTGTGGNGAGGSGAGGDTGTGGMAGHGRGGGGGASATGGAAGGAATGGASGAVIFSDDFESDTSGKQPAGWDNIISYNYKTTSNPMGSLSALADGSHAHGGKLAAHIVSDGSMVLLERALPSGINHLFVRAYVYLKNSIGMGSSSDNHETLLGLTMTPNNGDNQIRFGQIKGVVGTNQVPSDDIAPPMAKWNGPPVISSATWHCIEVEFNGTTTYNSLNAWSDSTLVHSIASSADWAHGTTNGSWMSGYFNSFMFGWQSFSSMANEVWVDDLVLSTARVGCN